MGPRRAGSPKSCEACLSRRVELLGGLGERPIPRPQPLSVAGCGVGLVAHARRGVSALLWGWAEPFWGFAEKRRAQGVKAVVEKSIPPTVSGGGADFRRLLKDIENRYSDAFADLGPGALSG